MVIRFNTLVKKQPENETNYKAASYILHADKLKLIS